jgi:dCTP deaminase
MSVKSDRWIRRMVEKHRMIDPFAPDQVRQIEGRRVISYGTSSYGYDVRCAPEFKVFTNINSAIVDPKKFDESSFVDMSGEVCIIPPNSFALARTVEYFRIPREVLTICVGKSTYARCGIIVNVTPLEPEWEGHVRVLEHHDVAREDLCERRHRADDLLRVGRGLRHELQGPRRQVPRAARGYAAEDLSAVLSASRCPRRTSE